MKKDPQSEIAKAAEPMRDADHLLDHEIDGLGRAVGGAGGVVGQDLRSPSQSRARQAVELGGV
jgi:hypothetical protein